MQKSKNRSLKTETFEEHQKVLDILTDRVHRRRAIDWLRGNDAFAWRAFSIANNLGVSLTYSEEVEIALLLVSAASACYRAAKSLETADINGSIVEVESS